MSKEQPEELKIKENNDYEIEELLNTLKIHYKQLMAYDIISEDKKFFLKRHENKILQQYLILSLYLLQKPMKLEYYNMKIISKYKYNNLEEEDKINKNFLVIKDKKEKLFVYNKNGKIKIREVNEKLNNVMNLFLKYNKREYLLLNDSGEKYTSNAFSRVIKKLFKYGVINLAKILNRT